MFSKKELPTGYGFLLNCVLGAAIGALCTVAVLFLLSVLVVVADISDTYSSPIASVGVSVGCFVGAYIGAAKNGEKGLFTGGIVGLITYIILTLIGLIMGNSFTLITLLHFIIIMLASLCGGGVGVNKRETHKIV